MRHTQEDSTHSQVSNCRCHCNLKEEGQWYYEVEITKCGLAQIGLKAYEGGDSEKGDGVGDDEHSWAFDGTRVLKWHKGANNKYGREWKVGDVVGCCIDMDSRSIKFSLNGSFDSPMGMAFDNIDADIEYMYPAITINNSFGGVVCFGGGMHGSTKYDPPLGYRCIFEAYDLPALDGHADSYRGEQTISSNARNEFALWVDDSAQDGDYVMNTVGLLAHFQLVMWQLTLYAKGFNSSVHWWAVLLWMKRCYHCFIS